MKIGYARVSTRDQNLDLQVDALQRAGCETIYQDVASDAKTVRPELDKMTDNAPQPSAKPATILLSLRIENNNSFVRGKKRVKDGLEPYLRHQYAATPSHPVNTASRFPIAPIKNLTAR